MGGRLACRCVCALSTFRRHTTLSTAPFLADTSPLRSATPVDQFLERMRACVRSHNGDSSEGFNVEQGLRQGGVLSPLLINIFFAAVVLVALQRISGDPDTTGFSGFPVGISSCIRKPLTQQPLLTSLIIDTKGQGRLNVFLWVCKLTFICPLKFRVTILINLLTVGNEQSFGQDQQQTC